MRYATLGATLVLLAGCADTPVAPPQLQTAFPETWADVCALGTDNPSGIGGYITFRGIHTTYEWLDFDYFDGVYFATGEREQQGQCWARTCVTCTDKWVANCTARMQFHQVTWVPEDPFYNGEGLSCTDMGVNFDGIFNAHKVNK